MIKMSLHSWIIYIRIHVDMWCTGPSSVFKIVKMIMERNFEPVIIFSFSKKECEAYALQMAKLDFNKGMFICNSPYTIFFVWKHQLWIQILHIRAYLWTTELWNMICSSCHEFTSQVKWGQMCVKQMCHVVHSVSGVLELQADLVLLKLHWSFWK